MARDHEHAQRVAAVLLQRFRDRHEVAQRLRHLVAAELEERVVHPYPGEGRLARVRLGLRYLIGMVREDEVGAAPVDVDLLTECVQCHRRAFDMPSRPASPQGLAQLGSPGFAVFQSAKSSGSSFNLRWINAGARKQVVDIALESAP